MTPSDLPPERAALLPAGFASKSARTQQAYLRAAAAGFSSPYKRRVFLGNLRGETARQAVGKRSKGLSARELRKLSPRRLAATSPSAAQARISSLRVLNHMRTTGATLQDASQFHFMSPAVVRSWVDDALVKENGEWRARPTDRYAATMRVLAAGGPITLTVRGSKKRSLVGAHWNAVQHYLNTGDETWLDPFRGKAVAGVELETDPDTLNALAAQGLIDDGPDGPYIYSTAA